MKAAIYARYSSENQRETSVEDQVRLCRDDATRRGFTITHTWQDREVSGQLTKRRPGLQEMLVAAKAGQFDVLIVDDASRLSRDNAEAQRIFKRLEFYRVGFIARSDGIDTIANPKSSRLVFGIKSAMNEEFIRDLGEKTWRGLQGRVLAGFSAGGLPYGYRSEPVPDPSGRLDRYGNPLVIGYKRLVFEPEAAIVRRIFALYAGEDGPPLSPREIAHRLNEEGLAPPGARWKNRSVRDASTWSHTAILGHRRLGKGILSNPLYIGRVIWNRSRWLRDPDTEAYTYRVRPQDDWVTREDPTLRIVPQALWDAVQARLAARRIGGVRVGAAQKYLLSGFLKCGVCGSAYVITNRYSYRCAGARNRGATVCTNRHSLPRTRAERIILAAIQDRLYTAETLAALTAQVRTLLQERMRQHVQAQAHGDRETRRRTLQTEIANLEQAVVMGKATAHLLEMLEARVRERDALEAQAAQAPAAALEAGFEALLQRLPDVVAQAVEDLHTLLATQQIERGRVVMRALVSAVTLHPVAGGGLEAEVCGDLRGTLALAGPKASRTVQLMWLGEEDSNPR